MVPLALRNNTCFWELKVSFLSFALSGLWPGRAFVAQVSTTPTKRPARMAVAILAVACLGAAGARAATLTVNTTADSSDSSCGSTCSLRDAINQANSDNSGDTIQFNSSLDGGTITLGSALPAINANITITGPGANLLTISGNNNFSVGSVFTISSGVTASIGELTIANGGASNGGGILNAGTLNLVWAALSGNTATADGGGVHSSGTLNVYDSTFTGNSANSGSGGGIAIYSGAAAAARWRSYPKG